MLILLMRHGIAVDREEARMPDADRPLTGRGIKRTREAARGLRALGTRPRLILTSPLVRAAQTAELVARELRLPAARVRTTAALLPDARPEALARELRRTRSAASVLCVGHAPHLDRLLVHLVSRRGAPITALKKAGVAALELDPTTARATICWLMEPKQLRALT